MGLKEKIKEKIQGIRQKAGEMKAKMDEEDKEYQAGREIHKKDVERGKAEARAVDAIAERYRLTQDKAVKGRFWINNRQYVDVDPQHPGTAERLEKVVNQQKSTVRVQTYTPPKTATVRPRAAKGGGRVSRASQQGDLGFKPRIHGKRPVDPTPDMPPYPGGSVMDGGFIGGGGFMGGGGDFIPGAKRGGPKRKARR